ncbi:hypothetical protein CHUAL_013829 [Chamberlinius hualienensis]
MQTEKGESRTFADSQREGSELYKMSIIHTHKSNETNSESDKTDNVYWRVNILKFGSLFERSAIHFWH